MSKFDAILDEVNRLGADGRIEDLLRYSGEMLAATNNELAATTEQAESSDVCARLLVLAMIHADVLMQSQMADEALGTLVLTLISVLRSGNTPQSIGSDYLAAMQFAFVLANTLAFTSQMQGDDFAHGHYSAMRDELAAVALATGELFIKAATCPEDLMERHESIKGEFADDAAPSARAEDAIDVLMDCAARMNALGLFNE